MHHLRHWSSCQLKAGARVRFSVFSPPLSSLGLGVSACLLANDDIFVLCEDLAVVSVALHEKLTKGLVKRLPMPVGGQPVLAARAV